MDRLTVALPPIDRSWWSWRGAHGGLLAALLLRQATRAAGALVPRSLHASFLESVTDEALRATTMVERRSWTSTVTRSVLEHGEAPAVVATTLFADPAHHPEHQAAGRPEALAPESYPELPVAIDIAPAMQHLEVRMTGEPRPLAGGAHARLTAWIRLRHLPLRPAEAVVVLLDSMPPALYAVLTEPVPIPSAEISVRFTGDVDSARLDGWTFIEVRTEQAGSEWLLETGRLWAADGSLLGLSMQTRRVVTEHGLEIPRLGELARSL